MTEIYLLTAQKIIEMFIFIAIGFIMRKSKAAPEQSGKALSTLETNVFLPSLIFNNLSSNLKVETITNNLTLLLLGVGLLIVTILVARLFSLPFGKTKADKNFYTYMFAFSNYAYFGYPLIQGVFGAGMLSNTIIFAIPFTITIYTYGIHLLTGEGDKKLNAKTWNIKLLSPVIIAVALGILCGFLSIPVPKVLSGALTMSASCMSPVSMILTGFILGAFPVKELFRSKTAYLVSFIRLIIIPVLFGALLWLAGLRGENFTIPVIVSMMPVGMNLVIFAEANNQDSKNSARICLISYIMAIITVPVIFGFLA